MHIVEKFALSSGLQIGKPYINKHYYPIVADKFICIQTCQKQFSRHYDHWNLVLSLLKSTLEKNKIKIVQIGSKEDCEIPCDIDLRGKTSLRQIYYIVDQSLGFIGIDGLAATASGCLEKPTLVITAAHHGNCVKPYWGDKVEVIEPELKGNKQPSFLINEHPKTINTIPPEKIISKALNLFDLKGELGFETVYMGDFFGNKLLDIIPNKPTKVQADEINIRMDLFFNQDNMNSVIENNNSVEITTTKPLEIKKEFIKRVSQINYLQKEFDEDFISYIEKLGIKLNLFCTKEENLKKERLRFFDYAIEKYDIKELIKNSREKVKENLDNLKFTSYKKVVSGDKIYDSLYEFQNKTNEDFFYLDLEWFYIYKKI